LVDRNGNLTEGSKSNIFMIKGNEVYTAPLENVLPGVTRGVIIEILKDLHVDFQEKSINESEIKELDALFISGTSPKVLPINKVDNIEFQSSENEMVNRIMEVLKEKGIEVDFKNSYMYSDSLSDLPLLKLVGHPYLINSKKKDHNIEVLHWK